MVGPKTYFKNGMESTLCKCGNMWPINSLVDNQRLFRFKNNSGPQKELKKKTVDDFYDDLYDGDIDVAFCPACNPKVKPELETRDPRFI